MPRRGRPGLMGTMARTAVIAGTATAVSGGVQRRQMGRAEQQQAEQQQMQPAPPAAAPADPASEDLTTQLVKLAELHSAGVLSDDEFASAKAKLLV
jgi:membrane protease subunit (stomatin/prohibitin family)